MAKPVNYIDDAKFLEDFYRYIEVREKNKKEGLEPPRIPEVIGAAFVQIANKLATRWNFNKYTFLDEMIADGILDAVKAVDSFDPEKGKKPFAYYTQIIFWAFVRRIEKEGKERAARDEMMFDEEYLSYVTEHGDEFNVDKSDLFLFYQD